ncbi:MAG TPA: hypothetical protein DEQ80_10750 [Anaerolinea thermolimosa]|uniref:6-hydroxymethylpterin diphosphokinase MptE-like domain-containing protein n=1 Tax=Anaerolinea thermolimosa TaxID=229919 RepID=A0A3D1JJB6_9CHLR|nr:hypothetical protein [Anaerolinea thermolimosa]
MSQWRESIKNALPFGVKRAIGETLDAFDRARQWPAATFHPWRRDSIRRLRALKDIHRGQRVFIIGNGPSLRQTDMSKLRNEYTIGMNRIFLMFPELGFQTTYLCSVNDLVIEQSAAELQALNLPRFVSWRARRWLKPDDNLYFLYTTYTGPKFSTDLTGRLWEGATVTNIALQVAFYLGFQEAILIGVDHNFVTQGKPNTTVTSQGDDPNHFSPAYFGKGFRWQLPDLETSERGYRMAREAYETAGRRVVDATVGGKLTIFPKVDYDSLF